MSASTRQRGPRLADVPTAPGRLPLLGHLLPLTTRPLPYVTAMRERAPLVRLYFGRRPVYLVTSPPLIRELLVERGSDTDKGSVFDQGKAFLGEGLVTSAGDLHRRQRRVVQPAFHHTRIADYAEHMRRRITSVADGWSPHQRVDLNDAMLRLAFGVITTSMFAVDLPRTVEDHLQRVLPVLIRGALVRALLPPAAGRLPTPGNRRYARAVASTREMINEVLARCEAAPGRRPDLVTVLQEARDPVTGAEMPRRQVADEMLSVMIAGTETTGGSLAWVFHDLASHPDVERKVHAELRAVVGDRPIGYDDVAKLEYTSRVLNESLRLRSIWLSTRRALRPIRLGDLDVPAGTELAFSLYAMHRDPHLFPDPHAYLPDRWLPPESTQRPRGSYIPFLDGNRKCMGDAFAWTEMLMAIATIAARWRLRPVPGQRVREVPVATIRPSRMVMTAEPR